MTEQNAPVVGVIVDNDHDGEPDVFEHSTALVERPDYEPVPVQPASAELVTPAEEQALAWRRVVETKPVVPTWMADREQRVYAVTWATRYFWHRAKFHSAARVSASPTTACGDLTAAPVACLNESSLSLVDLERNGGAVSPRQ
jgi:hypothetical protein